MYLLAQLPVFDDLLQHDCPYTLLTGVIVFQALVFGSITSYMAVHRGLSAARWFFAGFVGSVLGMFWTQAQAPRPGRFQPRPFGKTPCTYDPAYCPSCGASVHPSQTTCVKCGGELAGEHPVSEVELVKQSQSSG
jgi:hypothetical protein